ncbi:MAG: DNA polymerase III subunit alpha [Ignavibacteriales bacterium]|nr:DNA polymerase III subunit alpha [Ignavibacteriales bacterium]
MSSQFIHLHNHTHYSLLDGAATVETLLKAAADNNMAAVAPTDHGVMFGAIEFYKKAKKKNLKPIIGCEVYILTKGSRFTKSKDRDEGNDLLVSEGKSKKKRDYHHLILLCKDIVGYKNLIKLVTLGHTEGYYYKPRIDFELLKQYHEGLVCMSACAGGVVANPLINGEYEEAKEIALMYKNLFGDDFYLEIQDHGIPAEKIVLRDMPKLAKELNIKLVATNDCHYVKKEHAVAHNVMLLIPDADASNPPDINNLRYGTDQIHFKSADEMCELFKEYPEAIANTLEITEKCNLHLELGKNQMPKFPIPPDAGVTTLEGYLEKIAWEGLSKRYKEITPEIKARIEHELAVVKNMGYAGYFLIVADFIQAARDRGVMVGPGRGSAAGSIVAYATGITNVDPLKYDLLFERFLNPDRISMPDIDVDFSDSKREAVIEYVRDKYGKDNVAQIITFGTLSSKAVLKDVARVLGIPLSVVESINKQIPTILGKVMPIQEAHDTLPDLKPFKENADQKIQQMFEIAKVLEGMNRNAGMHAAGVVIAPEPLVNFVPMYKTPSTELMTQFTMKDLEEAGLLKMDFLGLRTLTVIENALELIKKNHGVTIDLDNIPENDAKTFDLFSKGQTVAVFQFESSGMQDWLRKLKPTSISDLTAMNALYRPGPMENIGDFIKRKHGQAKIEYLHPKMEPILKETYGVIVYQEQVMRIASDIGGFTLAKSDLMRRAMGKKDKKIMEGLKAEFIEGGQKASKLSAKLAGDIFDLIEKFASYGFNKSHSVAYSVVAYQTAYLKAQYPAEYMAATLTSEINNTDKIVLFIDDCRKLGLQVLPPDVNESEKDFNVTKDGIRFGLAAIKNVGVNAVDAIVKARTEKGKFTSLYDFCMKVDLRTVNKKTLEGLVLSGAFDSITKNRAQLYKAAEQMLAAASNAQEHAERGQDNLFGGSTQSSGFVTMIPQLPNIPMWSDSEKLSREKEVLGFYVSGHPLLKFEKEINAFATIHLGDVEGMKNGSVKAGGVITSIKKKIDKKGNTMAFLTIEDFTGKAECVVFSSLYKKKIELMEEEKMVLVEGKGEVSGDIIKIVVDEILPMEAVREKFAKKIFFLLNADEITDITLTKLRELMEKNKGNCNCYFNVVGKEFGNQQVFVSRKFNINPTTEFIEGVQEILGKNAIKLS